MTTPELVPHLSAWGDNGCPCGIESVTPAAKQLLSLFDGWYGDKAYRCHEDVVGWTDDLRRAFAAEGAEAMREAASRLLTAANEAEAVEAAR